MSIEKIKGCLSHNTDDWRTPTSLFKDYMEKGFIDCFPYHADYDEFQMVYSNEKLFANPPYSKLKFVPLWIYNNVINGCEIHLLIPARTDTRYFHKMLEFHPKIIFLKGRLHFNDSLFGAPFPSIIMIFKKEYLGSDEFR